MSSILISILTVFTFFFFRDFAGMFFFLRNLYFVSDVFPLILGLDSFLQLGELLEEGVDWC